MKRSLAISVLGGLILATGLAHSTSRLQAADAAITASPRWEPRLEALDPSRPMEYFELAEEVADAAVDQSSRELARHLFALAGVLDPERIGCSAGLALADMAEDDPQRRRFLAVASLLGGSPFGPGSLPVRGGEVLDAHGESAALAVAEAFSFYRRGRGSNALAALDEPGAMDLLRSCEHLLRGGMRRFVEDCKLYKGQLRPSLADDDIERLLRLEIGLLSGPDRPWSGELLITGGAPLIEVDPRRLEQTFGVDASRPLYRDGRWVAPEQFQADRYREQG